MERSVTRMSGEGVLPERATTFGCHWPLAASAGCTASTHSIGCDPAALPVACRGMMRRVAAVIRGTGGVAVRFRIIATRAMQKLGMREDAFLVLLAVGIGLVTAVAAVSFHELIGLIRRYLYGHLGQRLDLYHRGLALLILIPAAGGL